MRFFLALVTVVLLLTGCSKQYEWRQKLTFIIDTPDGQVIASNVYEVVLVDSDHPLVVPEARGARSNLIGEALAIEVTPDRYLFVLLREIEHLAKNQYEFPYSTRPLKGWVNKIHAQEGRTVPVVEWTPFMVTFEDVDDPVTVQEVDPDDLEAHFGEGFSIASITFEITSEPVTEGKLVTILKWIPEYRSKQLDGDRYHRKVAEYPFANSLNLLVFRRVER